MSNLEVSLLDFLHDVVEVTGLEPGLQLLPQDLTLVVSAKAQTQSRSLLNGKNDDTYIFIIDIELIGHIISFFLLLGTGTQ